MHTRLFILKLVCLLLILCNSASTGETVRITNGEWPPFTSEHFRYGGVLSRIVSEAFALEGIKVEYGYFPWKRSYDYAKEGIWDGSVGWAPVPKHIQDFYMSDPVIFIDKGLFHLKSNSFTWETIDDLSKWRVGGTSGYSYGEDWDQAVKEGRLQVQEVTNDEQNIKKLLSGRIDVFAMEIDVANYLMQTLLTPEEAALITCHPKLVMQAQICFCLSRKLSKSPDLITIFNRGLEELKAYGNYDKYRKESRRGDYSSKELDNE